VRVPVEGFREHGSPFAVGDQVREQHVGVQLRIPGAGGAMPERRADESGAWLTDQAAMPAADEAGFPLEVAERGGHRLIVRCTDYSGDLG
jgi:hypothetical protein